MSHQDGLLKAIRYFGTQQALGKSIDASQQQVNYWLNSSKDIPYEYVLKIEAATEGAVTRHKLVPRKRAINKIIDKLIEQELQKFIAKLFKDIIHEFDITMRANCLKNSDWLFLRLMSIETLSRSLSRVSQ